MQGPLDGDFNWTTPVTGPVTSLCGGSFDFSTVIQLRLEALTSNVGNELFPGYNSEDDSEFDVESILTTNLQWQSC